MFSGWGTVTSLAAISILLGFYVFYFQYYHTLNLESQNLDHELILITGGCGGIGGQMVEDLTRRKARVLVLDVHEP
ncbi:unnamed protein product [Penicillium salamii]|uniref:Uncharacterized protein n=1 Tax=Penicillium salamii TaxID=1612424 RepID=A0A9W4JFT3_9EURO|nr:unnamed protein product [Penicillium salamii]CAG8174205.1 unnamed protein product [Penicillium salamii]CAG8208114.1 unnamed protein product [Penicillium salamii]CAG8233929.1 unnamed protein product [Penicillium salamii]CAG8313630.1 unnamed protein product [Penicillium salamii]